MSERIADLLSEISRKFRAELRRAVPLGEAHLTPFQSEVIGYLGRNPRANPNALADRIGRDRGQITRLVAELEKLRLVTREKSTVDRRSVNLILTSRGQKIFHCVVARRAALSAAMLEDLTADEHDTLLAMLTKMRSSLETSVAS